MNLEIKKAGKETAAQTLVSGFLIAAIAPRPLIDSSFRFKMVFAILAFAVLCAGAGCARKPHQELIVGMNLSYPPFEEFDTNGNPTGVSVDLANALGEYLHRKVVVRNIRFDGLIPELKTGGIDLIISSMSETPKRAEEIDFSNPYLKTGLCLLVGAKTGIQSIQDADKPGRGIAVMLGTTGQLYAGERIKQARVVVLPDEAECVLDVVQGKEDAFLYDQMSTYTNWRNNPQTTRAILEPFQEESWAIGIKKGNTELRDQVNKFLAGYKAKGGFDALGDKWLAEQKEAFKKMGIPFYF